MVVIPNDMIKDHNGNWVSKKMNPRRARSKKVWQSLHLPTWDGVDIMMFFVVIAFFYFSLGKQLFTVAALFLAWGSVN